MAKLEKRIGLLELNGDGGGFLRGADHGYEARPRDPYIVRQIVAKLGLKNGHLVEATAQPAGRGKLRVNEVLKVNDLEPEKIKKMRPFRKLTSLSPSQRICLETGPEPLSMRLVDLITPVGRGTRGLIVAPPRTGKTTILKEMAQAVSSNHPDVYVIALAIDERPEEVTDLRRSINGEVIASSMDQEASNHRRLAALVAAAARRRVEAGQDVFLILDSITRLARAFNSATNSGGRTLSGGLDSRAMEVPRQIFGSARATEEAGSLTIIATALVETGSRMDELIFQEFKGTGNMELVLDRKMADHRLWPAVNVLESGTRKEELLQKTDEKEAVPQIRRAISGLAPPQAVEKLLSALTKHPNNNSLIQATLQAVG